MRVPEVAVISQAHARADTQPPAGCPSPCTITMVCIETQNIQSLRSVILWTRQGPPSYWRFPLTDSYSRIGNNRFQVINPEFCYSAPTPRTCVGNSKLHIGSLLCPNAPLDRSQPP